MNSRLVVEGLCGKRRLVGEIPVRGAKNAVLKSIAASLLFSDPLLITNVPNIEDVERMAELLRALGATVKCAPGECTIDTSGVRSGDIDNEIARRLRASIVLTGPLLARFGQTSFPHPGGDSIGPRPINLFLEGFQKMGAEVRQEGGRYILSAPQGLRAADIFFLFVSVTATETLMMAATLARGVTILKNAAMEPEVAALAEYLNACGAKIIGAGTPTITIIGGPMLRSRGAPFLTIPDRIEAGSFLLLGALAGKEIKISGCNPAHFDMLTSLLRESGVELSVGKNFVVVKGGLTPKPLHVRTHEYPGFATDLQPPMTVYLTQANGESTIFETIWGGRLGYTEELVRMGANVTLWNPQQLAIKGPTPLIGRALASPDIRAGLAFLIAAAIADGTSTIDNAYTIDRGYERIEERLSILGLNIRREQV